MVCIEKERLKQMEGVREWKHGVINGVHYMLAVRLRDIAIFKSEDGGQTYHIWLPCRSVEEALWMIDSDKYPRPAYVI